VGEADVRVSVGRVLAVLRGAGRAEDTVRRQQVVLDRFAAFLAGRSLDMASDRVCIDFIANQTGVRLGSLREPVKDRAVQAVRRPVVLMADVLAGRAVEGDRTVVPAKDGCPAKFRPLRDDYLALCRRCGNAEATVVAKDRAVSRFLAYLDEVGVDDLAALGVWDVSGFLLRQRGLRRKTIAAMRSCLADFLTSWPRRAGHRAVWRIGCRLTGTSVTSPSRTCGPRMRFAGRWPGSIVSPPPANATTR
jgi:hypothetical protein